MKGNSVSDHTDETCDDVDERDVHVTLCWKDTFGTDREYEMAFGYDASDGEPTAAIMWDGCDHPISIPISVMIEAIANGWLRQAGIDMAGIGTEDEDESVAMNHAKALMAFKGMMPPFLPGDPSLN